ncbi:MAG: hypothetical protein IPM17_16125 [Verrucomicrobia bacterium]|jgi:hypothetical protein|nr:hypothetical protein [Verrucomicrobiota bacterium]
MAVSETIVREFFESHGFLVHQRRKYVSPRARSDEEIDFLVLNPRPVKSEGALPFVLSSPDLARLERAIVVVKAWHTETFSPARLTGTPELFRFVEPTVFKRAQRFFGDGLPLTKILVVPALPASDGAREASVSLLRSKGVEAVIPFRTVLADLIAAVEPNRNYQKSDLLQTLRVLKNYDFFREPQMELFKPRRRARKVVKPPADLPEANEAGAGA